MYRTEKNGVPNPAADEGTRNRHKKDAASDKGATLGHFLFATSNAHTYSKMTFVLHKAALYTL